MRILILLFCYATLFAADHVVVIGVDGMGAAWLKDAKIPNIRKLMERGSWTLDARAVIPTVSSPNWASMINGAGPSQHGITSNDWQPDKFDVPPVCKGPGGFFPTLFGVMRAQRPASKIGVFHHWKDFARLVEKGAANEIVHIDSAPKTAEAAVAYWKRERPALLFVHLDEVDDAGHGHGWGSPQHRAAIEEADELIGRIVEAASGAAVIVTADHGGAGTKHGGVSAGEIQIPWIAAGPGVRAAGELKRPVDTYDTAPTVAHLLKLKPHECWIGKPVREALR